jgi:hypothetical protein
VGKIPYVAAFLYAKFADGYLFVYNNRWKKEENSEYLLSSQGKAILSKSLGL